MPELPEVEVLCRHLAPRLSGRRITGVEVFRPKMLQPTSVGGFRERLMGARFRGVSRRGKFLVFEMYSRAAGGAFRLLGHLGMTGRMYVRRRGGALPRHAVAVLALGRSQFVFEDPRGFGRLTLDLRPLEALGPEPWDGVFTASYLHEALRRSRQAVKVRLLEQSLVAGLGNIYASESLFVAGISPRRSAGRVTKAEAARLHAAIRGVLGRAIDFGSTLPLAMGGAGNDNGLFYFGTAGESGGTHEERLWVYDRAGEPCRRCGSGIRRLVQGGRSTFFCQRCQR